MPRAKCLHVAQRRPTKEPPVLTIELGRALVPYLQRRAPRIQTLRQHEASSLAEPKPLLILEWTHSRHRTKVMMQSRDTHTSDVGQLPNTQRLSIILPEPRNRLSDAATLTPTRDDLTQMRNTDVSSHQAQTLATRDEIAISPGCYPPRHCVRDRTAG
jgi:hypothetical protein